MRTLNRKTRHESVSCAVQYDASHVDSRTILHFHLPLRTGFTFIQGVGYIMLSLAESAGGCVLVAAGEKPHQIQGNLASRV